MGLQIFHYEGLAGLLIQVQFCRCLTVYVVEPQNITNTAKLDMTTQQVQFAGLKKVFDHVQYFLLKPAQTSS